MAKKNQSSIISGLLVGAGLGIAIYWALKYKKKEVVQVPQPSPVPPEASPTDLAPQPYVIDAPQKGYIDISGFGVHPAFVFNRRRP